MIPLVRCAKIPLSQMNAFDWFAIVSLVQSKIKLPWWIVSRLRIKSVIAIRIGKRSLTLQLENTNDTWKLLNHHCIIIHHTWNNMPFYFFLKMCFIGLAWMNVKRRCQVIQPPAVIHVQLATIKYFHLRILYLRSPMSCVLVYDILIGVSVD